MDYRAWRLCLPATFNTNQSTKGILPMKQFYLVLAALLVFSNSAVARDSAHMVSIAEAMQSDKYQEKLGVERERSLPN